MKFNDFAAWMLRSPFYWMMGKGTMLITLTGRKTGKPVSLPVNYHSIDGDLWITSRRDRVWWRNVEANPQVRLHFEGKECTGKAELVTDENSVMERLKGIYISEPGLARMMGIHLDGEGKPAQADLSRVANDRLLIKVSLN